MGGDAGSPTGIGIGRGGGIQEYDKSSKWLIEHHGDSILHLAGVRNVTGWKPLPTDLVQSRRFPDGVIEVRSPGTIRARCLHPGDRHLP